MPRINLNEVEQIEANEDRQRKQVSRARAIHRQMRRERTCRQCGGDCQTLLAAMQTFLGHARAQKAGR
jgi:hypothetical protein